MDKLKEMMIQGQIGYEFKNPVLLEQAFIRRSYAKENGGEDNESLEFIGDKALDSAVVRFLAKRYGKMSKEQQFICEKSEEELTELKKSMVNRHALAMRIDELRLADFLIMGNGDNKKHISKQESVKEDLFEAIIGAVAIDAEWNFEIIQSVVEIMLMPEMFLENEFSRDYVREIQEWELRKNHTIPLYKYKKQSYQATWYYPFNGISQNVAFGADINELQYTCELKLLNDLPIFRGFGTSKSEARKAVCEVAYNYLENNNLLFTIQDEIENPNLNDAVNQLEILARRGYFSIPTYNFLEKHDDKGNPIWVAECYIQEYNKRFCAESSMKKMAKKESAFDMLTFVLSLKKDVFYTSENKIP